MAPSPTMLLAVVKGIRASSWPWSQATIVLCRMKALASSPVTRGGVAPAPSLLFKLPIVLVPNDAHRWQGLWVYIKES